MPSDECFGSKMNQGIRITPLGVEEDSQALVSPTSFSFLEKAKSMSFGILFQMFSTFVESIEVGSHRRRTVIEVRQGITKVGRWKFVVEGIESA